MVPKVYLDCDDLGDFRAMPAKIGDVSGVKWVSVFPKNPQRTPPIPTVMGTIILTSATTGKLLAVLDGTYITKLRTAAAAAVASQLFARKDSEVASFIGCGGQTLLHCEAICHAMHNVARIVLFDLNREAAFNIASQITHKEVVVAESPEEAVKCADILTTLTPSTEPIVKGKWLKEGVHINAMGADAEGKREFDQQTYKMVDIWAYDDFEQAAHSGETQHAYKSRNGSMACMPWPKEGSGKLIGNISEFLGRSTNDQITLFDSTGIAIQDIAVANYVYEKLRGTNEF